MMKWSENLKSQRYQRYLSNNIIFSANDIKFPNKTNNYIAHPWCKCQSALKWKIRLKWEREKLKKNFMLPCVPTVVDDDLHFCFVLFLSYLLCRSNSCSRSSLALTFAVPWGAENQLCSPHDPFLWQTR